MYEKNQVTLMKHFTENQNCKKNFLYVDMYE